MMKQIRSAQCLRSVALLCGTALLCGCALHEGKVVAQEVRPVYSAASPEFRQATGSLLGGNFVPGNNITTLVNGREIFPSMLSAIRSARHSIDFETYVFSDGGIGKQFAAALAERARAGVKVDAQGTCRMVHVKLMVVDGAFVSVGSSNLDLRSIRLNDEANINVLSPSFAAQQKGLFENDKKRSREIGVEQTGGLVFLHPIQQTASLTAPEL
jgi:phosphatidylserine/phosphatidylglycerophosphate/cardiolipin synthase-like enzyme